MKKEKQQKGAKIQTKSFESQDLFACIHSKVLAHLLGEPVPAPAVVGYDGLLRRIDAGEDLGLYLVRGKGVAGAGVFVFHRLLVLGFAEAAPCCSQIKKFRTG